MLNILSTVLNYLRLYRPDAALLAFFSYVVGSHLAGGLTADDALVALAVSLLSMNFIYTFNSWADWKIDRINKPTRPIPSGKISPGRALIYSLVLLALSIIYPLVLFRSLWTLALFLLLPLLGLLYSLPPVRLKRHFVTAIITTSLILVIPIMLGYFMHSSDLAAAPFFAALFGFCLSVIPLKDIEDVEGDQEGQCDNWLAKLGSRKLLGFCLTGLAADAVLIALIPLHGSFKLFLFAFVAGAMIAIIIFAALRIDLNKLYRTIIRIVIVEGVVLFVLLRLLG